MTVLRAEPPKSTPDTMGRYSTMARSSMTSTLSTTEVSWLPIRSRSATSLATMPDDEM